MAEFKDIQKANAEIQTMSITRWDKKLGKEVSKDYAEVNQRIKAFRMVYPEGFIKTDIISIKDGVVLMKAEAGFYADADHPVIIGTGYALEDKEASAINKTSFIENCETSAVGRALGMCGFGIDSGVASYEEVTNAMAIQKAQEAPEAIAPAEPPKKQTYTCAACGSDFINKKVADATMKKYGKYICPACIQKKKEEMAAAKAKKEEEERREALQAGLEALNSQTQMGDVNLPFEI